MLDEFDGSVWELAHPDGSSIFVRHTEESEEHIVFGPFLFTTLEELEASEGSLGPHDLLTALSGKNILAQQISKVWVVEHAMLAFDPIMSDCVVVGEQLIPLSEKGARYTDNLDQNSDRPWQSLLETYGEEGSRVMVAQMVGLMFDQTEAY